MMIKTLEMVFIHKQIVHISSHTFYQSIYMGKELQILPENYDLF